MKEASFEVSALLNSFSFSLPTENLLQSEALQWVRVLLRLLTSRQFGLLEVFLLFFLVIPFLILVVYISKRNIFKFTSKGKHSGGKTAFLYKHSRFNEKAEARIRDEVGDYQPPWWYSPHLGTLVSFGADRKLQYEVEVMQAEDGGHFTVSWYPHKPSPSEEVMRKIIVFFPGLGLTAKNVRLFTPLCYLCIILNFVPMNCLE